MLGGLATLVMLGVGLFWWQGRAEVERKAPPASSAPPTAPAALPLATMGNAEGPALPEADEISREQRRFGRYDRDHDSRVSRNEMLSTRADAFRKLDKDGNNLLTFEEWAVATVDKFGHADADRDQYLSKQEFRTTAPPPIKPKPKCICEKPKKAEMKKLDAKKALKKAEKHQEEPLALPSA
ncbi:EF-hand domain-containing protein [Novosphingobium sp. Rr 2-17]|uniref:EF-hand domain-containing protein n=1 Tax=Novosphingobium sp. Rr 2-17 TaxID=555793 RepID=UPI003079C8FC